MRDPQIFSGDTSQETRAGQNEQGISAYLSLRYLYLKAFCFPGRALTESGTRQMHAYKFND